MFPGKLGSGTSQRYLFSVCTTSNCFSFSSGTGLGYRLAFKGIFAKIIFVLIYIATIATGTRGISNCFAVALVIRTTCTGNRFAVVFVIRANRFRNGFSLAVAKRFGNSFTLTFAFSFALCLSFIFTYRFGDGFIIAFVKRLRTMLAEREKVAAEWDEVQGRINEQVKAGVLEISKEVYGGTEVFFAQRAVTISMKTPPSAYYFADEEIRSRALNQGSDESQGAEPASA